MWDWTLRSEKGSRWDTTYPLVNTVLEVKTQDLCNSVNSSALLRNLN